METILREIRADLRLSMNGVTAASMRAKGVTYRMNFGVDILRIKQIATGYEPNKALAERMWGEDVRELKILATMLYPPTQFFKQDALRWGLEITNQEIREQVCKNLFQELSYAHELVEEWVNCDDENVRTTGYWLFARLCILRSDLVDRVEGQALLSRAKNDLKDESLLLRQAALNSLKFFGRISSMHADMVMEQVACFNSSSDNMEKEVFDLLSFEFEL